MKRGRRNNSVAKRKAGKDAPLILIDHRTHIPAKEAKHRAKNTNWSAEKIAERLGIEYVQ